MFLAYVLRYRTAVVAFLTADVHFGAAKPVFERRWFSRAPRWSR
jgi:hypothetical protein